MLYLRAIGLQVKLTKWVGEVLENRSFYPQIEEAAAEKMIVPKKVQFYLL